MKKSLFALTSLLFLSLTACKDTGKEPSNITLDGNATEQPANTPATSAANEATGQAMPTSTAAPAEGALNPAHGQPGHRCDIPVGAPLNSPAGGGNAMPTPTAQPAAAQGGGQPFLVNDQAKSRIMQEQGGQPATATSGKLNPAHGQPGHRCDIQVGQPLP